MSTVKSKKLQVGTDASASNNFTIYQPATPDGTLRIGVGNADSPTEVGQFNANGYKPTALYAFSAYRTSNQSISANTTTKIAFDTEDFDTDNVYDSTTNYRFQPSVSGYYQVNLQISWTGVGTTQGQGRIQKNGSLYTYVYTPGSGFGYSNTLSQVMYFNGTTDYIEAYARNSSNEAVVADQGCRFSAFLISQA